MDGLNPVEQYHFNQLKALGHDPMDFTFERQIIFAKNNLAKRHKAIARKSPKAYHPQRAKKVLLETKADACLSRGAVVSRFEDLRFSFAAFRALECIGTVFPNSSSSACPTHGVPIAFRPATRIDMSVNGFIPYYREHDWAIKTDGMEIPLCWIHSGVTDFVLSLNRAVWLAAIGNRDIKRYATIVDELDFAKVSAGLLATEVPSGFISFRDVVEHTLDNAKKADSDGQILRPWKSIRTVVDVDYHSANWISEQLTDCAVAFVIAHEYMHLIAGDTDLPAVFQMQMEFDPNPEHNKELVADCGALMTVMGGMYASSRLKTAERLNPELSCMGPILLFGILGILCDLVHQAKNPGKLRAPNTPEHPHPAVRAQWLLRLAIELLRSKQVEEARIIRLIKAVTHIQLAFDLTLLHFEMERRTLQSATEQLATMSNGLGIDLQSVLSKTG